MPGKDVGTSDTGQARRRWRRRVPAGIAVIACVALVALAITGAATPGPGLNLAQAGHWVYNHVLRAAFHVDGSGNVDAKTDVDAEPGSIVAQGDTQAYGVPDW